MTTLPAASEPLADSLASYLSSVRGATVSVDALRRLSGGASHETWAFDAIDAQGTRHALVLRRNYEVGLLDADLSREFALLKFLHAANCPVPYPCYCERDDTVLGTPFLIVERVTGKDLRKGLAADEVEHREHIGARLVEVQAAIHALDVCTLGTAFEDDRTVVEMALAEWYPVIQLHRRPALQVAWTWLKSHRPQDGIPCLVHGDFKANNVIVAPAGDFSVIDWEMAHIGDLHEDIAWTLLWTTTHDIVGGLFDRSGYLEAYEQASGTRIDFERLFYFEIFSLLKLAMIFLSAAPVADDRPRLPSHLMLYRALPDVEARLAGLLSNAEPTVAPGSGKTPTPDTGDAGQIPRNDALSTLHHLRTYLSTTILPAVGREHASELRAAVKLLDECVAEIDLAPTALREDIDAIDELLARGDSLLPDDASKTPLASMPALGLLSTMYEALWVRESRLADLIAGLSANGTDAAHSLRADAYRDLDARARRRARWQSVFAERSTESS